MGFRRFGYFAQASEDKADIRASYKLARVIRQFEMLFVVFEGVGQMVTVPMLQRARVRLTDPTRRKVLHSDRNSITHPSEEEKKAYH